MKVVLYWTEKTFFNSTYNTLSFVGEIDGHKGEFSAAYTFTGNYQGTHTDLVICSAILRLIGPLDYRKRTKTLSRINKARRCVEKKIERLARKKGHSVEFRSQNQSQDD